MDKKQWKSKEDFISYIEQLIKDDEYSFFGDMKLIKSICKDIEKHKHITAFYDRFGRPTFREVGFSMDESFRKKGGKRFHSMIKNQYVDINIFKKVVDNKILEYLNSFYFDMDIEPHEYEQFLLTIHHIQYFEQSGLSTHKSKYDESIKQLKKRADELQYYSKEPIEIIFPRLPQFTLSHFINYSSSHEIIKRYFYNYFYLDTKKRYPKLGTLESTYNEASNGYRFNLNTNIWDEYFKYKAHETPSVLSRLKKD